MKYLAFLFIVVQSCMMGEELPLLYKNKCDVSLTCYERSLVKHVQLSLEKALILESALTSEFIVDKEVKNWDIDIPYYHLLNNICSWKGASHLHIGLLKGGSFIAALYGNQEFLTSSIGVDWFQEYAEENLRNNLSKYLDLNKYQIIDGNCFNLDKSLLTVPVDIFLYDADHSFTGHEKAITFYDDVFADVFVLIIDDWKCPWVRRPTFKAFEKLKYEIIFEGIVPSSLELGHGQYVAVIRKCKILDINSSFSELKNL